MRCRKMIMGSKQNFATGATKSWDESIHKIAKIHLVYGWI